MILSVSRRTDIPAFYSNWFFNRLREGYVLVRNPMNVHRLSRIVLTPQTVDCIVFWTKNPAPMLGRLSELDAYGYPYYFQFTINPYDCLLERKVPRKREIFDTFRKLSDRIGPDRVIWRYDPIFISDVHDLDYHHQYFDLIAAELSGYTNRCVISFLDAYKKTERNLAGTSVRPPTQKEIGILARDIAQSAEKHCLRISSCAEKIDLETFGISHGRCIDHRLIANILQTNLDLRKDRNQRVECGCVESVDIGEYNTCLHSCLYCYANFSTETVRKKTQIHNPDSPLLTGEVDSEKDMVTERKLRSCRISRLKLE